MVLPDFLLDNIKSQAQKLFEDARGSHDWEHTLRVYRLCEKIGPVEGADMDVLRVAALLHDIGRSYQDNSQGKICHAEKGSEMACMIIKDFPLSAFQKANVIHCIKTHRFRGNIRPQSLEAKVLFDADKIDAIGAVGIARAFLFAGELGARLHNPDVKIEETRSYSKDDTGYREFKIKLCKIKERIMTEEGRRLAKERHEFMEIFFNRFLEEHEGKR